MASTRPTRIFRALTWSMLLGFGPIMALATAVIPANWLLPISVGIFNFQGTYSQTSTQILAAASVLSIVPAVVVFLVLQRLIIGALTAGAVKG